MKRLLKGAIFCSALLLQVEAQQAPASPEEAVDFPPRKFEPERYKKIWTKNPFVAEVVQTEEGPAEGEEWAKGLILRAVTRIEGKYVVHVEDTALANEKDPLKARGRYQRLVQDEPDQSRGDLRIVRVKAHRDPNQVEVTVSKTADKAGKEAVVKYDPRATIAQAPPIPRPTPQLQIPPPPQATQQLQVTQEGAPVPPGGIVVVPETANQGDPAAADQGGGPQVSGQQQGNPGGFRGAGGRRIQGDRGRGGRRGGDAQPPPERRVVLPPGVNP